MTTDERFPMIDQSSTAIAGGARPQHRPRSIVSGCRAGPAGSRCRASVSSLSPSGRAPLVSVNGPVAGWFGAGAGASPPTLRSALTVSGWRRALRIGLPISGRGSRANASSSTSSRVGTGEDREMFAPAGLVDHPVDFLIFLTALRARQPMGLTGGQRIAQTLAGQREQQVRLAALVLVDDVDVGRDGGAELGKQIVSRLHARTGAQPDLLFRPPHDTIERGLNGVGAAPRPPAPAVSPAPQPRGRRPGCGEPRPTARYVAIPSVNSIVTADAGQPERGAR